MIFRSILFNALVAGFLAGVLLSVLQLGGVSQIISAAETFEQAESAQSVEVVKDSAEQTSAETTVSATTGHDHTSHEHETHKTGHTQKVSEPGVSRTAAAVATDVTHAEHAHDAEVWTPTDGSERTFYTFLSNILAAIGFAAVLLALMLQTHLQGLTRITPLKGLTWGGAGFVALFVVPAIGLPPEIPGMEAAAIEYRQGWWLLAVSAAVVGLACLAFAPPKLKALGLAVMALPYLVGAPHPQGPVLLHPDTQTVLELTQLHADFVLASALTNLAFWLVLGLFSAYLLSRKLRQRGLSVAGV